MVAEFDYLFLNGMREILNTKIGSYPLYVYCLNDILNKGLLRRLESVGLLGSDYGETESVDQTPETRKIEPYLKRLFKGRPHVRKSDVLFVSRYRPVDTTGTRRLSTDYLFGPVINELYEKSSQLRMALVNVGGQAKHYSDDRIVNFSLFELVSFAMMVKSPFRAASLRLRYTRMAGKLSKTQREVFDGFFSFRNLLFCILLDLCLGKTVHDSDPRVIVANDDVMVLKPWASNVNTKQIVLQSASVVAQAERHRKSLFSSFLEDSLLPDYFCVSGPRSESLWRESMKAKKKIVVTGQPRFDILARANTVYDEHEIRKKFGLASDKKTLLWVTDSGLPLEEKRRNISVVYNTINLLKNLQLIIKPHPAEDQLFAYSENKTYVPIMVKGNASMAELLFGCDAMMTKSSTTVLEAAILRKPVIVLNLSGKPDALPYVEEGVAVGVYREVDLASAIQNVLYNTEVRERLLEEQSKFAYENAYVQDGKASERVAELILQMVEST
jgi:glycosyltransferase involved in cell wall biosynthesis